MKPPVCGPFYVAVRRDQGREWFDARTMSADPGYARTLVEIEERKAPEWAKANPVVRFAEVMLQVTDELAVRPLTPEEAKHARKAVR